MMAKSTLYLCGMLCFLVGWNGADGRRVAPLPARRIVDDLAGLLVVMGRVETASARFIAEDINGPHSYGVRVWTQASGQEEAVLVAQTVVQLLNRPRVSQARAILAAKALDQSYGCCSVMPG